MGVCHICYGPTPPYKRYCATCNLLCPSCGVRMRSGANHRCAECQSRYNRNQHKKRSPEEVKRVTVRATISKSISLGERVRTPCIECGGPGEYVHFPQEISEAGAVFLCKVHHRQVRPSGPRGPLGPRKARRVGR